MSNEDYSPESGKRYKSDGKVVNTADSYDETFKANVCQTSVINSVERGNTFFLRNVFENVADDATNYISFETNGNDVWLFAAIFGGVKGQIDVEYRKNADVDQDGTSANLGNRNDRSDETTTTITQLNPTVNDEGDLISRQKPGSTGGGPNKIGAETGAENPFLLARETTYLVKITNVAGSSQDINYFLEMIENTIVD